METCQNCGEFVSPDYVRVFGTNSGVVYGCPDCQTLNELRNGATQEPDL